MSEVIPLRKAAPKTVMGGKIPAPEDRTLLYSVFGTANDTKVGESNFGAWVGFRGEFEILRAHDQQQFITMVVFIPEPLQGMLLHALGAREDKSKGIDFAMHIYIKPANNAYGYEYEPVSVIQHKTSDKLAELRAIVHQNLKALPAPPKKKPEVKTDTKPENKAA